MGLWWHFINNTSSSTELNSNEIYLQIENNIIAIKLNSKETGNQKESREFRWKLYEYFKSQIPELKKKKFRNGKCMTVGFVEYDKSDYKEKITLLEKMIKGFENRDINLNNIEN